MKDTYYYISNLSLCKVELSDKVYVLDCHKFKYLVVAPDKNYIIGTTAFTSFDKAKAALISILKDRSYFHIEGLKKTTDKLIEMQEINGL